MRHYDEIDINRVDEADIQDRDTAIIELYDELDECVRFLEDDKSGEAMDTALYHRVLKKYREFVQQARVIYGK